MIWLSFWLGFLSAFLASAAVLAVVLWYEERQDAQYAKLAEPLRGTYAVVRLHSLAVDARRN